MKKIKTLLLLVCMILTKSGMSQNPLYLLYITNEAQSSPSTFEFDVFLLQKGTITLELANIGFGLGVNTDVINGGTLSASIISGSSELPPGQTPSNIMMANVNSLATTINCGSCAGTGVTYNYMNVAPASNPGAGNGAIISNIFGGCAHPGTKVGRFRISNTVNFTVNAKMDIVWSARAAPGQSNTVVSAYVNGLATNITVLASNLNWNSPGSCSLNPILNVACIKQPIINAGGSYTSCGNVKLNGSIAGSASSGTWSSPTGGIFAPNATDLNATYIPSITDMANGSVVLTLISDNPDGFPCVPDTDQAIVTFISCDDLNACTQDFCDANGVCQHSLFNIDDNNACTVDACNPLTGVTHTSINISDNNACTVDACDPLTANITHVVINPNDGNPCTTDGCNPVTGVFHTPIIGTPPTQPGTITMTGGTAKVCPGSIRTYTVPLVAGVTYAWTPPAGAVINSGQGTRSVVISYTAGFTAADTLRVVTLLGCGTSPQRKLLIQRNVAAMPSAITGANFGVCNLNSVPYSVTNVSGITYDWSFTVANTTIASGQGTNAITVNYGTAYVTGTMRVSASNACGTSAYRTRVIKAAPATAATLTGSSSVCANQQGVPYSVAPISGASSYVWTGPTGSHIVANSVTSPVNTITTTATSVAVNFANSSGTVKVSGKNICATGAAKSLAVSFVCRDELLNINANAISVYPNPVKEVLNVNFISLQEQQYSIELKDMTGRLVFSEERFATEGENHFKLKNKGMASGVYMLNFKMGDCNEQIRILVDE